MPIYTLRGSGEASVSGGAVLTVGLVVHGSKVPVTLDAMVAGVVDGSLPHPRPGVLLVPTNKQHAVIRATPVGSPFFPPNTMLELEVVVGSRNDPNPEVVRIAAVDVSGLGYRDLTELELVGNQLKVRALEVQQERELPALGVASRVIARELVGGPRIPERDVVDVVCAVDCSASMAASISTGTVAALIDILVGVCRVLAPGRTLRVSAQGPEAAWLPESPLERIGEASTERLVGMTRTSGMRAAVAPPGLAEGVITYLVTDAVPADIARIAGRTHLVVVTPHDVWELTGARMGIRATVIAPVGFARTGSAAAVAGASVPEESRRAATEHATVAARLAANDWELREIVRSLLAAHPGAGLAAPE